MNKDLAPYIISALELPPVNQSEATARAARTKNAEAFFETYTIPQDFESDELWGLIECIDAHAARFNLFILEAAVTGELDWAAFAELHAEQGRLRDALLIMIGADPDSEDLMARPVELISP